MGSSNEEIEIAKKICAKIIIRIKNYFKCSKNNNKKNWYNCFWFFNGDLLKKNWWIVYSVQIEKYLK